MRNHVFKCVFGMVLAICAAAQGAAAPAEAALAQRLCDLAQRAVQVAQPGAEHRRQAAALLEAAVRHDPDEPRYWALLAEVYGGLNDRDAQVRVLEAYRRLRPGDQFVQIELIDLYLDRLQTLHKKLEYLQSLLGREDISAEVKSELAVRAAALNDERGQRDQAAEMLARAIELNPLNLSALRAKEAMGLARTAAERAALWTAMLRANPAQVEVIRRIAGELSAAGRMQDAAGWYSISAKVSNAIYGVVGTDLQLETIAAVFLAGDAENARKLASELLGPDGAGYGLLSLAMLTEQASAKPNAEILKALRSRMRGELLRNVDNARLGLGIKGAATRPVIGVDDPLPDYSGDLEKWKAASPEDQSAYRRALGELLWFEVFFNRQPPQAERLLVLLKQNAGDADKRLAMLEGWVRLSQNRLEEARVKLSAVAAEDPLAALGLVKVTATADPAKASQEAARLLATQRAGAHPVVQALLWQSLREFEVAIPESADAASLLAAIRAFPEELLNIIVRPNAFYSLRGDPIKVSFGYGEPMWARITLQNNSQYPLTIGPGCMIERDLWVDVPVQSLFREVYRGGAFVERLTEQLVLRPRQSITRLVRVDQGELGVQLSRNPRPGITLSPYIRSNVGVLTPGYGDPFRRTMPAAFLRPMERAAYPVSLESVNRMVRSLDATDPVERMRSYELLAAVDRLARQEASQAKPRPEYKEMAEKTGAALARGGSDADPLVRCWAVYQTAACSPKPAEAAAAMTSDEAWLMRLLGALLAGPEQMQRLAGMASNDGDVLVRQMAGATVALMNRPATQPAAASGQPERR